MVVYSDLMFLNIIKHFLYYFKTKWSLHNWTNSDWDVLFSSLHFASLHIFCIFIRWGCQLSGNVQQWSNAFHCLNKFVFAARHGYYNFMEVLSSIKSTRVLGSELSDTDYNISCRILQNKIFRPDHFSFSSTHFVFSLKLCWLQPFRILIWKRKHNFKKYF